MSASKCPNCDSILRAGSRFCPKCGTMVGTVDEGKTQVVRKTKFPKWLFVAVPIILIILIGLVVSLSNYQPQKSISARSPRLEIDVKLTKTEQGFF